MSTGQSQKIASFVCIIDLYYDIYEDFKFLSHMSWAWNTEISYFSDNKHMRQSRGEDRGPDPPPHLRNHKNIGFLSNIGPDPLEKTQKI